MTPTSEHYRAAAVRACEQFLVDQASWMVLEGGTPGDAATRIVEARLSVSPHAAVHPIRNEGAYVEVQLWIPASAARDDVSEATTPAAREVFWADLGRPAVEG